MPIAVRVPTDGAQHLTMLVGLGSAWLTHHLEIARVDSSKAIVGASLIIADRDGNVISRVPDGAQKVGQKLPEWLRPLIGRDRQDVEVLTGPDGRSVIAAYVPSTASPAGFMVINTLALPNLTADIDQATYQDLLAISGSAIAALILAGIAGRRFIYRPTEALLRAARKWREGDLTARADPMEAGSEFSALAQSFNAMAAGLQAREMERRMQARLLEEQVSARTRELSDTNNRLQVEIAGREKTEVALHQAQKLQAVGQLAGGIAHDFNNMLATVLGNLELMERRVAGTEGQDTPVDAQRLTQLIERATGAVTRGAQLTSRLLAFSRRQRLSARATDINSLLGELITLASSTLGRRVQVIADLAEDLRPAMIDPSQVEAAILNLCLNARDAMPDGGKLTIQTANLSIPRHRLPRTENDLAPGEYVQIRISDTGTGMAPDVKARAFDPFFTTKGPGSGSGLGLSQVYGLARQSGGGVSIDSTPGAGTRVTLSLPQATPADAAAAVTVEPSAAPPLPSVRGELILVVDDDQAVRQVTVEMARDLGCEVAQAAGGEQALALVDKVIPSLILLDYAMPGMNGLQLARALRARGIRAPIALVTGYAELSDADIDACELTGLLRKPFTIRELQALLAQLRSAANADSMALEPNLADR
jgi:signal transduction histidine kinase/ActR/RegA family two-component response regulator